MTLSKIDNDEEYEERAAESAGFGSLQLLNRARCYPVMHVQGTVDFYFSVQNAHK